MQHTSPPMRPVRLTTIRRIVPNQMTPPRPSDRVVTIGGRARHR